jgi:hypothetical protein
MAEREHSVVYRAIANFDDARKKAREFRDELRALKAEQEGFNKSSASSSNQAEQSQRRLTSATQEHTRVTNQDVKAQKEVVDSYGRLNSLANQVVDNMRKMSEERKKSIREAEDLGRAFSRSNQSIRSTTDEIRNLGNETEKTTEKFRSIQKIGKNFGTELNRYLNNLSADMRRAWREADAGETAFQKLRRAMSATSGGGGGGAGIFTIIAGGADNLGRSITSLLSKFTFWPTIILAAAAAAGPLVAILGSLGAVALGVASNLVSLAGSVAALPGLIFAAATGLGAMVTAIAPLGGALKAYQAAQDAAGASAGKSGAAASQQAERVRTAARSVEQANRSVTDAERGVAAARRAVTDASRGVEEAHYGVGRAARAVEDAEYNLAEANYEAKRAQEAVNDARKDAIRDLEDLRREVDRSGLNEERAVLNLVRAQQDYARAMNDPTSSLLDRREALLRVREAENDLADVRRKNTDNANELAEAEAKGIENSDKVVDAKKAAEDAARRQKDAELAVVDAQRALVEANRRVADAQQNVADAQQRVIDAQYRLSEAKENVTDAERRLAEAQKGTAGTASAAATAQAKYEEALKKLSPAGREVLKTIISMKEGWEDVSRTVQQAMFTPVLGQLANLRGLLPVVENLLAKSGAALGNVASRGIAMISSGPWTKDFADQAVSNARYIENMGDAGLFLLDALRNITRAADPFTRWLTQALKQGAENFSNWAKSARDSGQIERFLEVTKRRLQEVWQITKNVGLTLISWAKAAEPFTDWMNSRLQEITGRWRDVAKAQESATSPLQSYLQRVKPLLTEIGRLFGDVARGFARVGSDQSNIERAISLLQSLRTEVLPAISRILHELGESGIDQAIVDAIAEILNAIATFLDGGGGQALSTFVTVLAGFVEVLASIAGLPVVGEIIGGVATALAALAAVAIVARFTGLLKIVDAFRWFVMNRGNLTGALTDAARGVVGLQTAGGDTNRAGTVLPVVGVGGNGLADAAKAQDRVGESATRANTKVSVFSRTVSGLSAAGSTARSGLSNFTAFLGGPWGVAIAAATLIIGGIATKLASQKEEANQTKDAFLALKNAYSELREGDTSGVDNLSETNEKFKDIMDSASRYGLVLRDVSGALNANDQNLDAVNRQLDIQIANFEALRLAAFESGGPTAALPFKKMKDDAIEFKNSINDVAEATAKNNEVTSAAVGISRTYEERLAGLSAAQVEGISLSGDYGIKIRELSAALDTMASSTATGEERSRALGVILKQETGSFIALNEATESFNSKLLDLDDAVRTNGRTLSTHSREGLRNRDALQAAAGAARELFLQDIASGVPMNEAIERHRKRIIKLREEATASFNNKKATDDLIKKYGEVPKDLQTKIKTDEKGFQNVYRDLRRLQYMQDALRRGLSPQAAEDEWKKAEGRRVTDEARARGVGGSASGPGYATGGPVYGPGTRTSDSIIARLSNGEFVQPTNVVEHYGVPVMEALRSKKLDKSVIQEALPDTGGYAKGGRAHSHDMPMFASGGSVTVPFVVNPSKTKVDENWVSGGLGAPGLLGDGSGSGGWKWQMAVLRKQFPGLDLISGFRPGSRTLSGNRSYHSVGRAVDLAPRRDVAKWIHDTYGKRTKELITPFQDLNLHNGRPHRYTGAVWNQHNFAGGNAHDHWAYKDGGHVQVPQFGFPSMDPTTMLSGMAGAPTNRQLSQAAQSVINQNRGVHVENLNVTNPVPERASDSLSRQVTKLAVLGDI